MRETVADGEIRLDVDATEIAFGRHEPARHPLAPVTVRQADLDRRLGRRDCPRARRRARDRDSGDGHAAPCKARSKHDALERPGRARSAPALQLPGSAADSRSPRTRRGVLPRPSLRAPGSFAHCNTSVSSWVVLPRERIERFHAARVIFFAYVRKNVPAFKRMREP